MPSILFNLSALAWVCLGSNSIAALISIIGVIIHVALNKKIFVSNFLILLTLLLVPPVISIISGPIAFKTAAIWGITFGFLALYYRVSNLTLMLLIGFLCLVIFQMTDGFVNTMSKDKIFWGRNSGSINGVTIYLFFIISLYLLNEIKKFYIYVILFLLATLNVVYNDSRQSIIPLSLLGTFMVLMNSGTKKIYILLFIFIIPIFYQKPMYEIFEKKFASGLFTERIEIWECFKNNIDFTVIFFGGYDSAAGSCAKQILSDNYLHSLYLDGLIFFGVVFWPLFFYLIYLIIISLFYRNYNLLIVYLFTLFYGFIESINFFFLIFPFLYLKIKRL